MKRLIPVLLLLLLIRVTPASGQAVVIDPSQIAASAINAADQIDFMFDQLGELTSLTDKLGVVKKYVDDVFGEDGIGGKAIGIMEDLGTLQRLTQAYNANMNSIKTYSQYLRESQKFGISDANTLLMYLNSSKDQAEEAVIVAKKLLSTLGLTKKEKKDEIDQLTRELEESLAQMETLIDIELETTIEAEAFAQMIDYLDDNLDSDAYVDSLRGYGTPESAAKGTVGLISLILGLLGVACIAWGYLHYTRGTMLGDSSADLAFLRIGIAMLAGVVMLNILSSTFGFGSL